MPAMVRGPTPINILLVEDDPSDVELTRRALQRAKLQNRVWIVGDGVEALAVLRPAERCAVTTASAAGSISKTPRHLPQRIRAGGCPTATRSAQLGQTA